METQTMATMAPTMNAHKDIPGNPSVSKSSNKTKLNDRSNGKPLQFINGR